MGRSPYGERGLKSKISSIRSKSRRRSPYGERGLKLWISPSPVSHAKSRSPYGERGLKFYPMRDVFVRGIVAPLTGSVD